MSTVTSLDSSVYYKEQYWDSFPQAEKYIQFQATGNPSHDSITDFKLRYGKKPFKHGLFLNCGNGWLERWFIKQGLVEKATAFDCSQTLIEEAKQKKGKLAITYFVADANTIELPEETYDLVVNSAALHHVQYLNRFCYQIFRSMKQHGVFFHYDYIGPHRNQYSKKDWSLINSVNNSLPASIRKEPLPYPHLPTMVISDPSEAIHSELITTYLSRYFHFDQRNDISGMIAYNILSLNQKLHKGESNKAIASVIETDRKAFADGKIPPLFSYMLTHKKQPSSLTSRRIWYWQLEENLRERDSKLIEWTYSIGEYWALISHSKKKQRLFRLGLYLCSRVISALQLAIGYVFCAV